MTKTDEIVERFRPLRVWESGGVRAPHKPLLVLWALGRVQRGGPRLARYEELERPLTELLVEFGPARKTPHPEHPFKHLESDGVWEVHETQPMRRQGRGSEYRIRDLRSYGSGGFPEELFGTLQERPEAVRAVGQMLLEAHFPESLHESIAAAAGVDLSGSARGAKRDPAFREAVLAAWGRRCAFCGYSVQLDRADLGLEAAHVRWVQAGGPDSIGNGLACCSLHHQAFDRGALTIAPDQRILVSSRVSGGGRIEEAFFTLHRREVERPNLRGAYPQEAFLSWHRAQVFKEPARD